MSSVLAHPDALISATTAPATASAGKSEAIFKASGLYPTPGAIDSFPARMLEQMQTEAALETLGHSDLRGRLYRPADSWQVGHQAVSPPVQPTLGVAAVLPANCFTGLHLQYLLPSRQNRGLRGREIGKERACETTEEKEGVWLVKDFELQ